MNIVSKIVFMTVLASVSHMANAESYTDALMRKAQCPDRVCMLRVDAEIQAAQIVAERHRRAEEAQAFCDYKGSTSGADAKTACLEYVRKTGRSPGQ